MKKNISINISGIIFHIEEDGYDSLRKYLDSINRYFGSFEDSSEILSDIESRIAEIFLSKLNEGKQVITLDDVNSVMATMGNVNDFKAAEEQEFLMDDQPKATRDSSRATSAPPVNKKLLRDQRRKILGGVCAGLGHYFNIDPVWPRVLFALLVLGSYGGLFVAYIILWIVLPASESIEEEPSVKKMYRDPEKKVIGGVASGVAAFFGGDLTLIRILFLITAFVGGLGFLLYVILWIALPEAKTITEKMEMEGEPVTLSNIESSVKKNLNEKGEEESTFTKIVLFPFRMIAAVINALGSALGPIVKVLFDVVRVFVGIIFVMIGLSLVFSVLASFGVFFGILSTHILPESWGGDLQGLSLPMEALRNTFPLWIVVFAFIVVLVPCLTFLLIGSSIMAKRSITPSAVSWTLAGLFFIGVLVLGLTIPRIIYSFKEDGEYKVERVFYLANKTPEIRVKEIGLDDYRVTDLSLKGYDGKEIKLVQRFIAQGATRKSGIENAQMVDYRVNQLDSVLEFDSNITFKKNAKFHAQRLDMDLFIPYNQPFVVDENAWRLLSENYGQWEYSETNKTQTWKLTEKGLECLTCPERKKSELGLHENDQYGFKDFNEIDVTGIFDLIIKQGEKYSVELDGNDREKKRYKVNLSGETLEIDYETRNKTFWKNNISTEDRVTITIILPNLKKLKVKGAGELKMRDFDESDMEISLLGAMVGEADIKVQNLSLDFAGPIVFELDGNGHFLQAEITKMAQLKASQYEVADAVIEAKEMGRVRVNATATLEMDTDVLSSIKYQGNPEVIKKN